MSNPSLRDQRKTISMGPLARDIVSVASLGIFLLIVHELGQPFIRGFYCDDETIRYPHKPSTVSSGVCYLVGSAVNLIAILLFEYIRLADDNSSTREPFPLKLYLRNVYCCLLVWFFGAISSELLTDISKVTIGRLRPHFIDVCKPLVRFNGQSMDLNAFCKIPESRNVYITDYTCSREVRDIRLSFMSGHSSYSAFSAAFAVMYLQSAMSSMKFGLLKPAVQVLIISAAFYTGLTRVSDYKHHWQDVLAGLLQGTSVALVVNLFLWPSVRQTYSNIIKLNTGRTSTSDPIDQELNRVSY